MRIVVVGAGRVGSFLGGLLAIGGHDVAFLVRRTLGPEPRRLLAIVDPAGARTTVSVGLVGGAPTAAEPAAEAAPQLVIFAVKQVDLPAAIAAAAPWPDVPALTVQNGVGAEEAVASARPAGGLIAASLTAPVELLAPAPAEEEVASSAATLTVRWIRRGGLGLAVAGGEVGELPAELAASLRRSGLPTATFGDAPAMKWSKLVANLVGNATSALLDADPADVYANRALFEIERRQLTESLAVMRALELRPLALPGANVRLLAMGIRAPGAISWPILRRVVRGARGGKMPSLREHLRAGGGMSEVRWLNGAVTEAGRRLGVPVPVNARLTALVEEACVDPERWSWFRLRPDRLLAALAL